MNKEMYSILKETGILKRYLIMLFLRSPFDILNSVLTANMMQSFIRIAEGGTEPVLWKNFWLYLILTTLLFGYNMTIWSLMASKTTVLLHTNLRKKMFDRMMNLSPEELCDVTGADFFTRLNSDVDKTIEYLTGPVNYIHMVIALVNLIISSVIMAFLNIELYVIGISLVIAAFTINVSLISRKITSYKTEARLSLVKYTDWINSVTKNREMLSIFQGEEYVKAQIKAESKNILKENMKAHNRVSLCNMTYAFSGMLGYLLILLRGNDIMGKEMADFGALCKMTQYRANSVMSVNIIYNSINNMKGNLAGADRVKEIVLPYKEKN